MIKTEKTNNSLSVNKKITKRARSGLAKEKWIVLLCAMSLFSTFDDMPLAVLALVFMQLGKSKNTKYLCGLISVAYFAVTFTKTAFYIPYTAFVFIWLVADYLLQNHRLDAVYPAVFTFVVTKWYMLSFGYEAAHWVLFAVETAAVVIFPKCVMTGLELLWHNEDCQSTENIFEVMCTLALIAFALDGITVWGIQFSTVFLLSAACFYGVKNNFVISFAALFIMIISLCQHQHFALLTAGFGAIYCSGLFFLSKGTKRYIGYIAVSVMVSALCGTQFNSLVFTSSAALSSVCCFAAFRLLTVSKKQNASDGENIGEKDYIQLKNSLEKLNRCFRFLGHTVIDISNLVAGEYIPAQLEDAVSGEVCRRCKNNTLCWQHNYSDTQIWFSRYAHSLQNGGTPVFDSRLTDICDKTEILAESFKNHNRLISTQKLMHMQGQHNRRLLQNQFLSMAAILQEITVQSSKQGIANAAFTQKADSFLAAMGKKVDYCVCLNNNDRCIVSIKGSFTADESYSFKSKLESIYGLKFDLPTKEFLNDSTIYCFSAVPAFSVEYGTKSVSRYSSCGDVWEYFATDRYVFVILADGMGTGSYARAESKTAVAMLKSLLTASVGVSAALDMTNIALNLKGTGQSCVAVDIVQLDLYDGSCSLYKAGAAPTVVCTSETTETVYKDSLPIGVLKDTKAVQFSFALHNGDMVVLASDGVNIDEKLMTKIKLTKNSHTPQQLAEFILNDTAATDDATAVVIKLVRR